LKKLSDLKIGEYGVIESFTDKSMSLKLMEMGCLPGYQIRMNSVAPLGDPISICIGGSHLSMRLEEAATILIKDEI